MTDFAQLQQELYALMTQKHDTRELRLLNVGTDHGREYHWRFRTPSGEIIMIRIEVEE